MKGRGKCRSTHGRCVCACTSGLADTGTQEDVRRRVRRAWAGRVWGVRKRCSTRNEGRSASRKRQVARACASSFTCVGAVCPLNDTQRTLASCRVHHVPLLRLGRDVGRAVTQSDDQVHALPCVLAHPLVPDAVTRVIEVGPGAAEIVGDLRGLGQIDRMFRGRDAIQG